VTESVLRGLPQRAQDRHFYSANRAFGRFGVRIFDPVLMDQPHWHGHVEINLPTRFEMDYVIDGRTVTVPADTAVVFWAGIPHQLTAIRPVDDQSGKLANIYLPLDVFLMMNHIATFQVAMLGGGMVMLPTTLCDSARMLQWYGDYRSGDVERAELVKMDLNALFRRITAERRLDYLVRPTHEISGDRSLASSHIRHVVAMMRHILENLEKPMRNAEIAAVTGLHENYALSLFTRVMQMPLKQFVLRMKLIRARALLVESTMAITSVAEAAGFSSISQFYAQFSAAYGMPPAAARKQYLRTDLG
jgi:AraC family transcriptional regulator, melibiose operon regulatory protein